jgi:hypothetical protein
MISESVTGENVFSPIPSIGSHGLKLEMFALSKKSAAEERRKSIARRKEERE